MQQVAKVLVGSRLHGLDTPTSDYDYRGIHMHHLRQFISPFNKIKTTSWIEGDEDNTSYELSEFCKNAVHGNATYLEVFFSDKVIETSVIHKEIQDNWEKFFDTKKFIAASRGYAHNQWNKFYNFEDVGENGQHRTAKFAVAFIRVMWQLEQFLLDGKFKCDITECEYFDFLKEIKPLSVEEIRPLVPEIVRVMGELDRKVAVATANSRFINMKPDIAWIEDFLYRSYISNE